MNKVYVIVLAVLLLAGSYIAGFDHARRFYVNVMNENIGSNNLSLAEDYLLVQIEVLDNILSAIEEGNEAKTTEYISGEIANRKKHLQRISKLSGGKYRVVAQQPR